MTIEKDNSNTDTNLTDETKDEFKNELTDEIKDETKDEITDDVIENETKDEITDDVKENETNNKIGLVDIFDTKLNNQQQSKSVDVPVEPNYDIFSFFEDAAPYER